MGQILGLLGAIAALWARSFSRALLGNAGGPHERGRRPGGSVNAAGIISWASLRLPGFDTKRGRGKRKIDELTNRALRFAIGKEDANKPKAKRNQRPVRASTVSGNAGSHLHDENGAFTLTGRNPRRQWLAGISAQRGF